MLFIHRPGTITSFVTNPLWWNYSTGSWNRKSSVLLAPTYPSVSILSQSFPCPCRWSAISQSMSLVSEVFVFKKICSKLLRLFMNDVRILTSANEWHLLLVNEFTVETSVNDLRYFWLMSSYFKMSLLQYHRVFVCDLLYEWCFESSLQLMQACVTNRYSNKSAFFQLNEVWTHLWLLLGQPQNSGELRYICKCETRNITINKKKLLKQIVILLWHKVDVFIALFETDDLEQYFRFSGIVDWKDNVDRKIILLRSRAMWLHHLLHHLLQE